MDFSLSAAGEALRRETVTFLDAVLTPQMLDRCHRTGVNHDADFSAALAEKGWLALGWPVADGGQGRDPLELIGHTQEMQYRGAPTYGIGTTMMVAAVIREVGTAEQQAEILPRVLAAEIVIALGFTEPESGSDAAAAATRAVREGEDWVINGSKMFTTNGHLADYVFLLTRTDPAAAKHRGLTVFLVPMDSPGIEVQAVRTLSGERTNITYYSDVRVADRWRIGEVDGGWAVMGVALAQEHGTTCFAGEQRRLLDALRAWAAAGPADGESDRAADPGVQEEIGRVACEVEISLLLQQRAAWQASIGEPDHGRGSMSKLFSTERLQRQTEAALSLVGPEALREGDDPAAPAGGVFEHLVRHSVGTTIYAGTSEIQRNIIAQHVLGLPRPS